MVEHLMSNSTELQQVEDNIKQASELVEFGSAVERLRSNRDFRKVIIEGYFEQEAVRLVHAKADAELQSIASQASIVKQMDAIGALSQFLMGKLQLSGLAERSIAADEETRQELLVGGLQ